MGCFRILLAAAVPCVEAHDRLAEECETVRSGSAATAARAAVEPLVIAGIGEW
jgi:hypothetical protein